LGLGDGRIGRRCERHPRAAPGRTGAQQRRAHASTSSWRAPAPPRIPTWWAWTRHAGAEGVVTGVKMRVALKDPRNGSTPTSSTTAPRRRWWGRTATSTTASSATLHVRGWMLHFLRQPHADQDAGRLRLGQHPSSCRHPRCRRTTAARATCSSPK
jgi:hypothetical protein